MKVKISRLDKIEKIISIKSVNIFKGNTFIINVLEKSQTTKFTEQASGIMCET